MEDLTRDEMVVTIMALDGLISSAPDDMAGLIYQANLEKQQGGEKRDDKLIEELEGSVAFIQHSVPHLTSARSKLHKLFIERFPPESPSGLILPDNMA